MGLTTKIAVSFPIIDPMTHFPISYILCTTESEAFLTLFSKPPCSSPRCRSCGREVEGFIGFRVERVYFEGSYAYTQGLRCRVHLRLRADGFGLSGGLRFARFKIEG